MRILVFAAALLMLAGTLAPGLASSQDSELILRVAMQDDMKGTNPLIVGDVWSWNVLSYIFDDPINTDPDTDEIVPYIAVGSANVSGKADSWADCAIGNFGYSPKNVWQNQTKQEAILFYDFTNITWHDGVQMTVRDIMFSMHLAAQIPDWSGSMNPLKANGGAIGSNFSAIGWLHVYKVWESADGLQAALRFQVQEPFADFFRSTISTFLLPEHIWNTVAAGQLSGAKIWCDTDYLSNPWLAAPAQAYENAACIGSGPFKFEFHEVGHTIKISTWRDHFFSEDYKYRDYVGTDEYGRSDAKQPEIDAVTYKIFRTAEAAVLALKSDDIDYIAWSVPPTYVQELANEPGIALQQNPEKGFFYLAYNMRRKSFGYNETGEDVGKPLRRAIAHCIDKQRIVQRDLLNLGVAGTGPVSPFSEWYNSSVPTYDFDPEKAKQILADAGYKLTDGSINSTTGLADVTKARNGNWWLNPDGSNIGSSSGGLIDILTPEGHYDPISYQRPAIIAEQLRDIGIYAQSVAMDFGSIVDRIDERDFDMYILGWSIGSEPADYLHAFFHSDNADVGQNYPGYNNASFDALIDLARSTGDPAVKKKAILDAQAAICYDLPYDVLYYRTNIEAYRSDRFTGWVVGDKGSIFNLQSLYNIHAPGPWKVIAQFMSPPSAVLSNSTTQITVYVRDQDGNPLEGAGVKLNATAGALSQEFGNTSSTGKLTVTYTAPYSDPNDIDSVINGSGALISIEYATYVSPEYVVYEPAPSRITLVKVFPEGAEFLSVSLTADPDVIDSDIGGTPGFTYVDVLVVNQDGVPVENANVGLSASPAVIDIEPADQRTDAEGRARFRVTVGNISGSGGTVAEYSLSAIAIHPTDTHIQGENTISITVVDLYTEPPPGSDSGLSPAEITFTLAAIFVAAAAFGYMLKRRKKA